MMGDREDRGPLWVDGRLTVRVRGPGPEPGRVVRIGRPFALVGRLPGAEIRLDDPAVEDRHVFLLLDRRGVFAVDLLTRAGTRFAGAAAASARLGAGDIFEVAGRRVELLRLTVDGAEVDPPLSDHDPLAEADPSTLAWLALEPLDVPGPPWMLGSALAFAGQGEACAIRVEGASASPTHCALLRGPSAAYVIDLLGRPTLLNGRPVEGASPLLDGDVLALGRARFAVRVGPPRGRPQAPPPDLRPTTRPDEPATPDGDPRSALLALLPGRDGRPDGVSHGEALEVLRHFLTDAAALFEAQVGRIEGLGREIASLRAELRGRGGPPDLATGPPRLDLPPRSPSESTESAAWLLDRIQGLETESRSTWIDLIGRVASTVRPRAAPIPPPSDHPS